MKLQQLGGGRRERGGWWSATNISVTWACVQNAPYVHMCAYVLGEEGSLHRAFADVTLLNNHSASIRQAENGALSIRQPKDTQLIHFSPCVVRWSVQWVTELILSLWSNIPCRMNTYWWDIMLFVEMTLCYSAGNEKTLNTQYKDFFFFYIASCLSPDSSKSWPFNYDWLIWDILTLEN